MAEISDEELVELRGAQKLMSQLLKSPKTRTATEKAVKELYPETVTTDDVVAPYMEEIKGLRAEVKDFLKSQQDTQLDTKLNTQLNYLKSEREFTDDGIEKIKKFMVERSIPDAIDAADLWEKRHPPIQQEPSILAPTDWGFGRKTDDADLKLLFEDEDAWAEKEAGRAWAEETKKRGQFIS